MDKYKGVLIIRKIKVTLTPSSKHISIDKVSTIFSLLIIFLGTFLHNCKTFFSEILFNK